MFNRIKKLADFGRKIYPTVKTAWRKYRASRSVEEREEDAVSVGKELLKKVYDAWKKKYEEAERRKMLESAMKKGVEAAMKEAVIEDEEEEDDLERMRGCFDPFTQGI